MPAAPHWHTREPAEAIALLDSDAARGLASPVVQQRRAASGPNLLRQQAAQPLWRLLLDQFANFMTLVLVAAAVIAGAVGEPTDSIAILAIVVLNALVGFVQEYRAANALAALRRMAPGQALVVRDGQQLSVAAAELVPGDVVVLEAGAAVPADLRLLEVHDLKLGEASLTGESVPVDKTVAALPAADLPLGDRRNMAFKGTSVLFGRGRGLVVAIAMQTEIGRIATLLTDTPPGMTPLQRRLARLGRQLAIGAIAVCGLILLMGLLNGEPPLRMLLTALSLAVAAIPEALPAVVTALLAFGAWRMAQSNALIRRLPAVEALGSVAVICSDKTGTLTENRMRVTELALWSGAHRLDDGGPAGPVAGQLWAAMALCNDVARGADGLPQGDPTEVALWEATTPRAAPAPRVMELPFDSSRMRMTTFHRTEEGLVAFTKGAPEAVIPRCTRIATDAGGVPVDPAAMLATAARMAEDGLRVLAFATRAWPVLPAPDDPGAEQDLVLLGLVGLMDRPRPEARAAVATCRSAGIVAVMITGDHPATALAVARALGIAAPGEVAVTGPQLAAMDDAALLRAAGQVRVYARVDPAQKIRIVDALQRLGLPVAMTGDGVNDAPALARADIGVAMGRGGTDVARDAAGLVLLDDNFATIVLAVREGRRIYDNIRKFVRYVVTCNSAEVLTIFLAPLLGLPVPLLPIQILWINLVTDGLPGLALAAEGAEPDAMRRPPRPAAESLFAGGMGLHVVWVGALMAGLTLATQAAGMALAPASWQTMVFTVLTFAQMAQVLAIRSERVSLLRLGLTSNVPLLLAVGLTCLLHLGVLYIPALNAVFGTRPLGAGELAACVAVAGLVLLAVELEKLVRRRTARRRPA